ncbi:dihydrodipicolinate synthase family protein [Ruania halotolerans]|uniref:dihydrodipicolinate synthase family protein n=1 Tax=Ruania halotolerans TaxID=2897773 RepID=UPI001E2D2BF9|nr:dihydrodipicolinate synthase family protein [Ruania halotolerans]UFU06073.1 dihydrodipicolinate synthase family protein [Ruania halotolerans]
MSAPLRTGDDLTGVFCPLITPLDHDGALDRPGLERHVDRVVAAGDAVMALGTSGELPILPAVVAEEALEVIAAQLDGRTALVCGVGDVGTERTLANVRRAKAAGADVVAVTTPFYYPLGEPEMIAHYLEVAERSDLPVAIYNIPINTHLPVTRAVMERVAAHPNVVAIKDSGGDGDLMRWLLETRSDTGLKVLQGTDEAHATQHWQAGIDGYVSGLENLAPGTMLDLAAAVRSGDTGAADRAQQRMDAILGVMEHGFWLSVLKEGAALQGIGSGRISPPLPALSLTARAYLEDAITALAASEPVTATRT